jgi:protein-disulfide isomerase
VHPCCRPSRPSPGAQQADCGQTADAGKQTDPRALIAKKFPEVSANDVTPSPIPGIWQFPMGADVAYVSGDGKYIIAGDLYEIDSRTNITEQGRAASRVKLLAKLDDRDLIVFSPQVVKHTITVFTDVECGYCRKLHSQIDQPHQARGEGALRGVSARRPGHRRLAQDGSRVVLERSPDCDHARRSSARS